ncbi:hypothetical protein AQPW35_16670 [Rubrivivax pictus]|uniref:Uncharacterized protein n=1 Tax=Pseudaquabacterium pictum TaxID=2315236 RepID=A0A480ANJ9_9BURK|nr:hypothetical protein AQPW35_16670 [Rubrivivax pictus]
MTTSAASFTALLVTSLSMSVAIAQSETSGNSTSVYGLVIGGVYEIPNCPPYDGQTLGVPYTCAQTMRGNKRPFYFSAKERPSGLVPNFSSNADASITTSQSVNGQAVISHVHFGVQIAAIQDFRKKFGEPRTFQVEKSNSYGAKWNQLTYEWKSGAAYISAVCGFNAASQDKCNVNVGLQSARPGSEGGGRPL